MRSVIFLFISFVFIPSTVTYSQIGSPDAARDQKSITSFRFNESFARYDFIPGEKVIFYTAFQNDRIGELPQGWNSNGDAIVAKLKNTDRNFLRLSKNTVVLSSNNKSLGQDFTIEFDLVMQFLESASSLPDFNFGFLSSGHLTTTDNALLNSMDASANHLRVAIHPSDESRSSIALMSFEKASIYFESSATNFSSLEKLYGESIHISMQIQKERFRCWVNGMKVYDIPKALPAGSMVNQFYIYTDGTSSAQDSYGQFINDIKIASGQPDLRQKLIDEGKFTTTGILFDVNQSIPKPGSIGVLSQIADLLKQYPSLSLVITGHTDSDGDAKTNQTLSQDRATAIRDILITTYGIDSKRVNAFGKGHSQPITPNTTAEGKAANRRVEFTKINF